MGTKPAVVVNRQEPMGTSVLACKEPGEQGEGEEKEKKAPTAFVEATSGNSKTSPLQ